MLLRLQPVAVAAVAAAEVTKVHIDIESILLQTEFRVKTLESNYAAYR